MLITHHAGINDDKAGSSEASHLIPAKNNALEIQAEKAGLAVTEGNQDEVTPTFVRSQSALMSTASEKKKLGSLATAFVIFKAYIITAILFLPHQFLLSGWAVMLVAMGVALILNLHCNTILVEVHDVVGGTFPEIAERTFGRPMKILAEFILVISQFSYAVPYIYFFATQFGGEGGVLQCATSISLNPEDCSDGLAINRWYWMPILMLIIVPLVCVRNIKSFQWTYTFIDIAAFASLITLCAYATRDSYQGGFKTACIEPVGNYWPAGIGVSIFTFEGVGVILPIKETMERKEDYAKVMVTAVSIYGVACIAFSAYALFAFGAEKSQFPLVTESMPRKSPITWTMKLLYCVIALLTYPLMTFPITTTIDSYVTAGWPKSWKRTTCENLSRCLLVALTCIVGLTVYHNLPHLNAIAGAIACCPMAFTLPALFHLKLGLAKTKCQKFKDVGMLVISIIFTAFTTEEVFRTWNEVVIYDC